MDCLTAVIIGVAHHAHYVVSLETELHLVDPGWDYQLLLHLDFFVLVLLTEATPSCTTTTLKPVGWSYSGREATTAKITCWVTVGNRCTTGLIYAIIFLEATTSLPRREDVLAQVGYYVVIAVVCRADNRSAILLVQVTKAFLDLSAPFHDHPCQENFQMVPSRKFNVEPNGVFAQSQTLHCANQSKHRHDIRVLDTQLL